MKTFFRKFVSILMAVVIMAGISTTAFAGDAYSTTTKALQFNEDGKFRIMHVTDTHLDSDNVEASVWLIAQACDRENPDLVVVTGDNVTNDDDANITKKHIDMLMNVFQSRNIPTAITFGNHDSETGAMTREELMAYYNTFSCSISLDDGPSLTGCGTYNIPVMASDGSKVKFNVWVFDSNDYDGNGHYGNVKADQVEWYKQKSDELKAANGGEVVYSVAFQHIIVPEVYDALKKVNHKKPFSYEHIINKGEYYMFDPDGVNFGTLTETPCSGGENDGQFDAMVEKGDVLAMYTGHDHTNGFGVRHKGIDISNTVSSRYNGDAFSSQYGYRIIDIDEADTSKYTSRVEHWYDMFTLEDIDNLRKSGDDFGWKLALDVDFRGFFQKAYHTVSRAVVSFFSGRQISYED